MSTCGLLRLFVLTGYDMTPKVMCETFVFAVTLGHLGPLVM